MLKKLKSRRGLTLVELLVTTVILSLFSCGCLVGISTAFKSRSDHIKAADADILKSSVIEAITQELRLSQHPKIVNEDGSEVPADPNSHTAEGKIIRYSGGLPFPSMGGEAQSDASFSVELFWSEDDGEDGLYKKGRLVKRMPDVKDAQGNPKPFICQVMNDSGYGDSERRSASESNLQISDLKFQINYDETNHDAKAIKVTFRILDDKQHELQKADFTVMPINEDSSP